MNFLCAFGIPINGFLAVKVTDKVMYHFKDVVMKFAGVTSFCSLVLFLTFTFVTSKTNLVYDNWHAYGWPAVFLKRFRGDDFFLGTDYVYWDRLLLDVLVCTGISLVLVFTVAITFGRKAKRDAVHQ